MQYKHRVIFTLDCNHRDIFTLDDRLTQCSDNIFAIGYQMESENWYIDHHYVSQNHRQIGMQNMYSGALNADNLNAKNI